MVAYAEGTSFSAGRHAWNTGFLLRRQVQDADDIAYFDTLLDRLVREHGAEPSRLYMTGGSNGGMMTFVYAVALRAVRGPEARPPAPGRTCTRHGRRTGVSSSPRPTSG